MVLIFLPFYLPGFKSGGPVQAIANLVDQLGENFEYKIFTSDRDHMEARPYEGVGINEWNRVENTMVYYCPTGKLSLFVIYKVLSKTQYDVLYMNSFFSPKFTLAPLLLRRLKLIPQKPVILAPRGELAPAALRLKAWKKKPFMLAARLLGLHYGVTWHASTWNEKNEIVQNIASARRVMIAEQIYVAEDLPGLRGNLPERTNPKQPGRLKIIFLSRICRMKNLELTLDILSRVKGDISFHIYGPVADSNYWVRCKRLFRYLPQNVKAEYRGVVNSSEVIQVLSGYDLFFLPTLGENYGHAIWEAMIAGCPVLISDRTPWCGLRELGVGWDLPLSEPDVFRQIIEDCAEMDQEQYLPWSTRAREYGLSKIRSTEVLERNINLFHAALLNGNCPKRHFRL